MNRYLAILGAEHLELTETEANAIWDDWPAEQRTGKRDGAFILWSMDERGCRVMPLIFRRIGTCASVP
jgi:hypothetical protein